VRDALGRPLYLLRFKGGPHEGNRSFVGDWPPPARFEDAGGYYRKTQQSQLPGDVDDHPHIARGAEYEWTEAS
jgi:hypothetical protein